MQIIIGLGNPGDNYAQTRHNTGWLALDYLAGSNDWHLEKKFNAMIKQSGDRLYLKPQTFMNNSGESVYKALSFYHLLAKQFIGRTKKDQDLSDTVFVIHDDLDLDLGAWKISGDSRSAGHRGVQSIINHLKTKNFTRLRLGIKTSLLRQPIPPEKFVLQRFDRAELDTLKNTFEPSLKALEKLI